MMKVLFFGTPKFSEIVLEKLIKAHQVVGVVCRAGKPSGRGNKIIEPHIVDMAKGLGIKVYQPENLKANIDIFKNIDCDIFVTASYGKIIPKEMLDLKMCINVHPSMLPKYRGATPIQTALLNGDTETGVTIMKTDVGMDSGDIILQEKCKIDQDDDYNTLMPKLAELGGELLGKALEQIENGIVKFKRQDDNQATFVKLIKKEDAFLDFENREAEELVNMVRAYVDDPTAYFYIGDKRIKVFKAKTASNIENFKPCEIFATKKELSVQAKQGAVQILSCQAPGGKVLNVKDFLNGFRFSGEKANEST